MYFDGNNGRSNPRRRRRRHHRVVTAAAYTSTQPQRWPFEIYRHHHHSSHRRQRIQPKIASLVPPSAAASSCLFSSPSSSSPPFTIALSKDSSSSNNNNNSSNNRIDVDDLTFYQSQRDRLQMAVDRLDELKESICCIQTSYPQHENNDNNKNSDATTLRSVEDLRTELTHWENRIFSLAAFALPPRDCDEDGGNYCSLVDYYDGIRFLIRLPVDLRMVLCQAIQNIDHKKNDSNDNRSEEDDPLRMATDFDRIPEIVSKLYLYRNQWTTAGMERARNVVKVRLQDAGAAPESINTVPAVGATKATTNHKGIRDLDFSSLSAEDSKSDDQLQELQQQQTMVEQMLPGSSRVENRVATKVELDIVKRALDGKIFKLEGIEEIPGGYIFRGENRMSNASALVDTLDSRLRIDDGSWNGQVCFIPDFTVTGLQASDGLTIPPVLVLLHRDMSPQASNNPLMSGLSSLAAVATVALFAFSVNGGDAFIDSSLAVTSSGSSAIDAPAAAATTATAADLESVINAFNGKMVQVIMPVFAIQALHEAGHWIGSYGRSIKPIFPPTFLPFWQLPWLGSITRLRESPRNLTVLFDFAIAGPIFGLTTSAALLAAGLRETALASPDALQSFPALPTSVLKLSTAGCAIVDAVLNGGLETLALDDPTTPVPMHPWAIAGFTGLLIQSLELLPLGATDGGRISLAMFGRTGHVLLGSAAWTILLLTCLFAPNTEVLLAAWIMYNFLQHDLEVPCREEVNKVDLVRGGAAIVLWFLAILVVTPVG
jgi:membrane-associated protease RseP (regulator of RpoE activity)